MNPDTIVSLPKPTIGRIVHYVLNEGHRIGEHRPAIIVRVWSDTCVQLQVFTDSGVNPITGKNLEWNDALPPILWKSSASFSDSNSFGTWHWPERE